VISIVIPIYNEELLLERLNADLHQVMENLHEVWEVIYVNDGSNDHSLDILTRIHNDQPDTVVVADLSRNWGHQQAITAGLSLAQGDAVVVMDGDFQDPPALISDMVAAWKRGADVVIARRTSRNEHGLRRFLFPLFYRVLGFLSDYPIPLSAGIFGLMDRKVCDLLAHLGETNRFLPGLRSWVGFQPVFVEFERPDRPAGKPKQTLLNLFKYGFDAILSFRPDYGWVCVHSWTRAGHYAHPPSLDLPRQHCYGLHQLDVRPASDGQYSDCLYRNPGRVHRPNLRRGQAPSPIRDSLSPGTPR
jgi:glycosyltransferase involved in cell wall biosynthesis